MTTEATERDLVEEVEELLAKATPGPWNYSRGARCYHVASADGTFETACIMFAGGKGTSEGNAKLIAATPELLRRLVEEVKRVTKERDEADQVLKGFNVHRR